MMKGRETFYSDHTVPITSCSEVQYVPTLTIQNYSACIYLLLSMFSFVLVNKNFDVMITIINRLHGNTDFHLAILV